MMLRGGFEPPTLGFSNPCSNQLSYQLSILILKIYIIINNTVINSNKNLKIVI